MGVNDVYLSASIKVPRRAKNGKDAVSYEILLDTDSVVLKSDTKKFETHKLGDVHFIYHQGSYTEDMTSRIIETYSYIILYYGYESKKDDKGNEVLGSDGKPVMEYKVITYSANEGVTDIYNTMQTNVGDDADCYGMKYIWYDKNLPDDDAMFEKIWSELDGIPPKELGIKILATKMFTVRREADSIKSSDVVFGISGSNTQPPTSWITNFSDLVLEQGKYVWTCTKTILTSSSTPIYTGAYCLGKCYDFAQVVELYALSDSSTKEPNDVDFSSSYKVVKGKYLWSCVKVTYSNNNIKYLNKRCVNYFPNDGTNGTKFTPKGTAYGHYEASSKMPKPSDDVLGLLYLVDKVDTLLTPVNKPCVVWWRSFSDSSYMLSYDAAEEGDAYNVGGTLWVHDGKIWHDFGSIQGPKGDDGEDALSIELSTEKILFDYYEGNFDPQNQAITLVVRQGGNVIKSSEYNVKIVSSQNFDIDTDYLTIEKQDSSCTLNCYANGVNTYTYTYNDGVSYVTYPASSCSIKISVEYNGITYFKEFSIEVSFVKMYGGLYYDTEQLSSTYGELVGEGGRLSTMETNITQNAENIKLTATRTDGLEKQYSEIKVSYNSISAKVASTEKGLLDTGINITDKTIKMTANNFTLYNNKGEDTFSADEYGNGVFKGTITATGGSFGSLQMTSYTDSTGFEFYGMHSHTAGTTMIASSTYTLDYQGLYVGTGLRNNGGSVYIGHYPSKNGTITNGVFDWENGVINVEADNSGVSNADISGIGVNVVGNFSHSAIGMKVSATGGKNNYAVDAENGDIRVQKGAFIGVHRGNVRKVTSSTTLLASDSTIICNNTASDIVVTLPSDLAIGTFFRIIKKGKTVTLRSASKNISLVDNRDLLSEVSSTTAREWIHCLWDGDSWLVEMSRS